MMFTETVNATTLPFVIEGPRWKINGHEVEWYINKEHRIVKATIKSTRCDVDNLVSSYLYNVSPKNISFLQVLGNDELYLPKEISAVAKCHPSDTFDVEVGMKIAYRKLQNKYNQKFNKRILKAADMLTRALEGISHKLRRVE